MTPRFDRRFFATPSLAQHRSALICEAPQELLLRGFAPFIFCRGGGMNGDSADPDQGFQLLPVSALRSQT